MTETPFIKLSPKILLSEVQEGRLRFLILPKTDLQEGQGVDLVAYGKDEEDGFTGFMRQDKQRGWQSSMSGWADRCASDRRPVRFDEATKCMPKF
jgi:hypothetical protein